jgi:retron-type reverse transcriptase
MSVAKASNELESSISQLKMLRKMELFETTLLKGKTQAVSMSQVVSAYAKVKSNGGAGGVDGVELPDYEANKAKWLYKLWNRMASGSYNPQAVRSVEIPKSDGSKRVLGIPTITDRIAQWRKLRHKRCFRATDGKSV